MAFRRDPKRSRIVIATMAIVCGLIWASVGANDLRTGQAAGYAIFDFIMMVACCGYGIAFLKRVDRSPESWSILGMIVVAGGSSLKDAIKAFKGGGLTFDGGVSLVFVAFWILLAIMAVKTSGRPSPSRL
jgi:hypothetical protein